LESPKHIVQTGYDRLGSRYRVHFEQANPKRYTDWLNTFAQLLPADAKVLELGCADGIPTARYLSERFEYLGIDISPVQVEQARTNVPLARFQVGDMAALTFPDSSFDGIIALYSIIHIPLSEQPDLFRAIYNWLMPAGYLLCVVGAGEWTGTESDWIQAGTRMYWSHADATTYQAWFTKIGFAVINNFFVAEGDSGHTFFLLKK
jgi:SAM-dependent methyltransferase